MRKRFLLSGAGRAALVLTALMMSPANAAEDVPAQAFYYLAQAHAINAACHFLSDSARDELATYVARAEVAAVERLGLEQVRAARQRGVTDGNAAGCRDTARATLNETLLAARQAVAQIDQPAADAQASLSAPQAAPVQTALATPVQQPVAAPGQPAARPATAAAAARPAAKPRAAQRKPAARDRALAAARQNTAPAAPRNSGLDQYGAMAERYYYVRRCGGMSSGQVMSFYGRVVSSHRAAVSAFGVPAVAGTMRRAEARARSRSCG